MTRRQFAKILYEKNRTFLLNWCSGTSSEVYEYFESWGFGTPHVLELRLQVGQIVLRIFIKDLMEIR